VNIRNGIDLDVPSDFAVVAVPQLNLVYLGLGHVLEVPSALGVEPSAVGAVVVAFTGHHEIRTDPALTDAVQPRVELAAVGEHHDGGIVVERIRLGVEAGLSLRDDREEASIGVLGLVLGLFVLEVVVRFFRLAHNVIIYIKWYPFELMFQHFNILGLVAEHFRQEFMGSRHLGRVQAVAVLRRELLEGDFGPREIVARESDAPLDFEVVGRISDFELFLALLFQ